MVMNFRDNLSLLDDIGKKYVPKVLHVSKIKAPPSPSGDNGVASQSGVDILNQRLITKNKLLSPLYVIE